MIVGKEFESVTILSVLLLVVGRVTGDCFVVREFEITPFILVKMVLLLVCWIKTVVPFGMGVVPSILTLNSPCWIGCGIGDIPTAVLFPSINLKF